MREKIKRAIGDTVQDLILSNVKTSFTEKELKELGVIIPKVKINARDIKKIRCKSSKCKFIFCKTMGAREKNSIRFNKNFIRTAESES